jgi:simple sugar transport system ATP-binding protein
VILDEPTAVLAPSEARDLWAATERLAREGRTVVFITHKLEDVMAHADSVTVLRRGKHILTKPVADTNPSELAGAMISGEIAYAAGGNASLHRVNFADGSAGGGTVSEATKSSGTLAPTGSAPPEGAGGAKPKLMVRNLTVRGTRGETLVSDVSLELRAGEILGLAGVDGSGQIELIEAIMGLRSVAQGSVFMGGDDITKFSVARGGRRVSGMCRRIGCTGRWCCRFRWRRISCSGGSGTESLRAAVGCFVSGRCGRF